MHTRSPKLIPEFRAVAIVVSGGFAPGISVLEGGQCRVEPLPGVYFDPLAARLFAMPEVEHRKHEAIRALFADVALRLDGAMDDETQATSPTHGRLPT
jgi:hypothetical protein